MLFALYMPICLSAQTREVKGKITSADDGKPVIGATARVKGTSIGAASDLNGNYVLSKVPKDAIIVFSYLGMKAKEIKSGMRTVLNVKLEYDAERLGEVVVTGITTTDKRLFTGATDRLKADEIKMTGISDVSRSLEGRSAGVSVQNVSGTFGAAPKIRIRGATSILGSSKPLWVVDGVIVEDVVEVSADDLASGDPNTLISSAIAGLNSEDIESFQILKDGSATSIYGARAMAGVIVITTKKGKAGVSSFNYMAEFTNRLIPNYADFNIMNSQEQMGVYQEMEKGGWLNFSSLSGASTTGIYGKMYQDLYVLDPVTGLYKMRNDANSMLNYLRKAEMRNTDWFRLLFNNNIMQNHSVSISSGSKKSSYYASVSMMTDPGWTKASEVKRYTSNFNASFKLLPNLKLNLISSAAYRTQKAPGSLSQDTDVVSGQVKRDFDINPYSYSLNTSRALSSTDKYTRNYAPFNIFDELDNNYIDINVVNLKFQGEFQWDIMKGLTARVLGAVKYNSAKQEHHITEFSNQAMAYRVDFPTSKRDGNPFLYKDPDEKFGVKKVVLPEGGIYNMSLNELFAYDFRASMQYSNTIAEDHIINVFMGSEANSSDRHYTWNRGWGLQYSMGEVPFYDYKMFKKMKEEGTNYYGISNGFSRNLAFFGNLTYSYQGKYTINGTLRYEGSNKLGKSRTARWLPTWNISGSWNAGDENFFEYLNPVMSSFILKASYSLTADRGPASNSAIVIRSTTPWRHNADIQEGALYISSLENSELTYEKKTELNIGAEMGFLNNNINFSFDWYRRNNYDLIGPINSQGIGGEVKKWGNVASMKSNGIDLSLSTVNIKTKDFKWTTSFVYSHINNEVTKLENNIIMMDLIAGSGFTKVGYPVRSLFSIPFNGLNDEGLPTFLNRDNKITTSDIEFQERHKLDFLEYSGSVDPTDIGSLGNTFSYKGLKLNLFLTYSFGNVVRLTPFFSSNYSELDAMPKEFNNRWSLAGDEKLTDIPVIATRRQYENNSMLSRAYNAYNYSSARVAKGDFIRLKEISLTYDFSKSLLKRLKIKNLSLKLQGTNLFLLYADKKLNGQDPEFFNTGGVAVPMPKQYTLTLKIGL